MKTHTKIFLLALLFFLIAFIPKNVEAKQAVLSYGTYKELKYAVYYDDENSKVEPTITIYDTTNTDMYEITVPSRIEGYKVTTIYSYAFYECKNLANVYLPETITTISSSAFYNCANLSYIKFPNSLRSLGNGAFYGCKSLTTITIPNGVTISPFTFDGSGVRYAHTPSNSYYINGLSTHCTYNGSRPDPLIYAQVTNVMPQLYTGKTLHPTPVVMYGNTVLKERKRL